MEHEILRIFLANQWLTIPIFIILVIGVTLFWFGGLMAALTALGNNRWGWGLSSLVLGPITGFPYSLIYNESEYPKSLMIKGLLFLLAALALSLLAWAIS
ncbi:hypothetical protein HXX02_04820 [Microbulbifer elongatus]|uniref:Uncharacterized protein n=1 Tax=Microbulbifer elongatus TaxID=86173 RepID=A0ABT1NY53_9GAMM|nr:hypothetical protein [Microbulbifer elongatus]MCQ3828757.1 hypothetical protein [Microbulbifer elongatus]